MRKILAVLFSALLICCTGLFFVACDNTSTSDNRDPEIVAIYNLYVATIEEKGETPLSYEDWLESIKGEKGDPGNDGVGIESIRIDENGHLMVKYTNSQIEVDLGKIVETKNYSKDLDFELNEDQTGYILTGIGYCNDLKVVIPNEYNGKPVVAIGEGAFVGEETIKAIIIPDSVTSIGYAAFDGCYSLTSVTIGESVTSIGDYAFYECRSLASIEIPDSLTSIGDFAFSECYLLTSVTIPDSVTSIGEAAFYTYRHKYPIFCEAVEKPSGWDDDWGVLSPVVWDCNNNNVSTDGYTYVVENSMLYVIQETEAMLYKVNADAKTINIPNAIICKGVQYGVTSIQGIAFNVCTKLRSVTFEDASTWYRTDYYDDCLNKTGGNEIDFIDPVENARFFRELNRLSFYGLPYFYKI